MWTATALLPAALLSLFALLVPAPAWADLSVSGLPTWLEPAVRRSLDAVWNEIPKDLGVDREGTLSTVAGRLFVGYDVEVRRGENGPAVRFVPEARTSWDVELRLPEFRGTLSDWFRADVDGLVEEIAALLRPLPEAALTWADEALRARIAEALEARTPGWDFSLQVAFSPTGGTLTISFRPGTPLVLAVTPSIYSRTIPVMLQSDLQAKLVTAFSPLVGLPVSWVAHHRADAERMAQEVLEERHSVENMRAQAEATFVAAPVAKLDARVDSDRFLFQVWVSAYAGLEDRYPEAGAFFGWNTANLTGVDLELYGEAVVELEAFELTRRLGLRLRLFGDLWAGAEVQWPEEEWFGRLQWGPSRMRRPYLWWRWSPELGQEGALGYRVDEHISIEIYYDGTNDDRVGLRGLWSL